MSLAEAVSDDDPDPHQLQPQPSSSSHIQNSDPDAFEGEPSLESMAREWERKCAADVARCMVSRTLGYDYEIDSDSGNNTCQDADTDPDKVEQLRVEIVKAQTWIKAPQSRPMQHPPAAAMTVAPTSTADPLDFIAGESTQHGQPAPETMQPPTRLRRLLQKTPSSQASAPSVLSEVGPNTMQYSHESAREMHRSSQSNISLD